MSWYFSQVISHGWGTLEGVKTPCGSWQRLEILLSYVNLETLVVYDIPIAYQKSITSHDSSFIYLIILYDTGQEMHASKPWVAYSPWQYK